MKKTKYNNMLIHGFILVTILATAKSAEAEITMEAAFQGHCGHTSPCEQLCYEIHDGMYECDCIEGYELNKNGYSCQVINTTANGDLHSKSDEDVLYQKGASFSAKLANDDETEDIGVNEANENQLVDTSQIQNRQDLQMETRGNNFANLGILSTSSLTGSEEDPDLIDGFGYDEFQQQQFKQQQQQERNPQQPVSYDSQDQEQDQVNSNDYYISDEDSLNLDSFKISAAAAAGFNETLSPSSSQSFIPKATKAATKNYSAVPAKASKPIKVVLNGKLKNLRTKPRQSKPNRQTPSTTPQPSVLPGSSNVLLPYYKQNQEPSEEHEEIVSWDGGMDSNANQGILNGNMEEDYYAKHEDMSVYDDVNNNQLNLHPINQNTYQAQYSAFKESSTTTSATTTLQNTWHVKSLNDINSNTNSNSHTNMNHGMKLESPTISNISIVTSNSLLESESCSLDCGPDGACDMADGTARCLCAFGKTGTNCLEETKIRIPKFSKNSWIAFPALRGAYKHVQIRIEFRPETFDGIILLSGERDDLTGDFVALLLNKGFVEFWFDCGSGVGHVRSRETVLLNEWNSIIIYRHRWDAWLVLNHGSKVQGRSNGLFSRITFREPVFLGGTGNITGLIKRLPIFSGFEGCIRSFIANEHEYKFEEHPNGDVTKGFDIQDCETDKCFKFPCKHGGKCLPSDDGAVCLCPIGFVGDLCEIRMDLQVPAFNGSSYLQYAPLGEKALIWLELKAIVKPEQTDGIIMYSGPKTNGDFIALTLTNGFVEFAFDLGSGPAIVRSESPLAIGQWHTIRVSRTARLAVLKVDNLPEVMTISSNGFWHLSLPHNLFVGGVSHVDKLPLDLTYKAFFVGCIQKIEINGHSLAIVSEALGGTNIGNCPHACVARPCGPLAECVPQMESYECRCNKAYNAQCNKEAEVTVEELNINKEINKSKMLDNSQELQRNEDQLKYEMNELAELNGEVKNPSQYYQGQYYQKQVKPQSMGTAGNELRKMKKIRKLNKQQEEKLLQSTKAAKAANLNVETLTEVSEKSKQYQQHPQHPQYPQKQQEGEGEQGKRVQYQHHIQHSHNHNVGYPHKNFKKLQSLHPSVTSTTVMGTASATSTTSTPPPAIATAENFEATLSNEEERKIQEMIKNDEIEDDIIFRDVHGMHKRYGHSHGDNKPQQVSGNQQVTAEGQQGQQGPQLSSANVEEVLTFNNEKMKIPNDSNQPHHHHHHHHHPPEPHTHPTHQAHHSEAHHQPTLYEKSSSNPRGVATQKPYHEKYPIIGHKLSRLPTHYESFQTNPDSDILTFDENIDWEAQLAAESAEEHEREEHEQNDEEPFEAPSKPDPFVFDESLFDDGTEDYQRKQLTQDMERIMTNEHERQPLKRFKDEFVDYDYKSFEDQLFKNGGQFISEYNIQQSDGFLPQEPQDSTPGTPQIEDDAQAKKPLASTTPQTQTDWSLLKKFNLDSSHLSTIGVKKNFGACFSGTDSYFHYNDAETMSHVISCDIDLNLRIKTHSINGVLLWTGRQSTTTEDDDYLSLGLEDGYLHFRYDLGSGEADIIFNVTKLSDGLWHRIRAIRNSQEGYIEVDGRKTVILQSPGKLRQLNTDTGLYVGGLPDVYYFTRRRYNRGIVGCISEIIVGGELKLNFDPNTLGTSHNVETGIL